MKINYITGRAGSGKSYYTYQKIKDSITSGKDKNILIVPEQYTLQGEVDLITKMNLEGIINVQVLSFKRLAFRIMSEVGGIKKNLITDLGKIMTLRRIFEENKNNLAVFSKAYHQEGFIQEFSSLISEFKKNGVTEAGLKDNLEKIDKNFILKSKISDISIIYKEFVDTLAGKYIDEEETLNILYENIKYSSFLKGSDIWIDGFNSFSVQEYKVLEELMKIANEVTFTLTTDLNISGKDYDLFNPTINTYKKMKEISERNHLDHNEIILKGNYIKSPEISHLEENLYSYPAKKYTKKVENIKLTSALNLYNEVENAAINIVKLVRDCDYKWKDIAVVTNALDVYSSILKRVFYEYDIPVFVDDKKSISGNPLVNFIKSSLRIIIDDYKWGDIFLLLKTGFIDISKEDSFELQNYILENGIKGKDWRNSKSGIKNREMITLNIEKLRKNLKNSNNGKDYAAALFEYLNDFNILEKLEIILKEEKDLGNFEFVNENSQIWNIIIEIFEQISEIIGEEKYSIKDLYKILESGFNGYELGVIPPTMDQVLAGNLERSKSHDIKALFLLGCNDGVIPRSYSDGGILLDNEKIKLQELGMGFYKDNLTEMKEEKFLLYSAFTKPSEKLFISWSLGDIEGKALRPSLITDRIKRIFPEIKPETDLYFMEDPYEDSTLLPTPGFKFLTENLRNYLDYGKMDIRWWEIYSWYFYNPYWEEKLNLLVNGLFHENQIRENEKNNINNIYLSKDRFSISRLETYSNCPFKHFVKYGLRPEEKKEYKVELPDIGNLFHGALEVFPEVIKRENINWEEISTDKAETVISSIVDKISEEFQNGLLLSSSRNMYLKEKLKRISKRAVKTLTNQLQQGEFHPWKFEFPFKEELDSEENITLEGRIDRLDIWKDDSGKYYLRVIDYKSGNKKFNLNDIYNLIQLQLIIYLTAAIFEGKKILNNDVKPGGAFYFRIDDPFIEAEGSDEHRLEELINNHLKMDGFLLNDEKNVNAMDKEITEKRKSSVIPVSINKDDSYSSNSMVFSEEELSCVFAYVKNMSLQMISHINEGDIKIKPAKGNNYLSCTYCKYFSICQFDTAFPENYYRKLEKFKKDEILNVMAEKRFENE